MHVGSLVEEEEKARGGKNTVINGVLRCVIVV